MSSIPEASVILRRTIPVTPERLFKAWTDPAQLGTWFGPPGHAASVEEMDVRVGGRYRFGMVGPALGEPKFVFGEYREITPPSRVSFTWSWEHDDVKNTLVTIDFNEVPGGTELVLMHAKLPHDKAIQSHTAGWTGTLDRLVQTIQEGE